MEIKKVIYETGDCFGGCETCDYGSSYITNLTIRTNNCIIEFEFNTMYNYISESNLIQLLSREYDSEWALINKFKNSLDLEDLKVKINFLNI